MNTWNELKYNVSGESRKRMVGIIEQLTGEKAVYLRTPTCSYDIGPFNVGRQGELTWAEDTKPNTINQVIAGLAEQVRTAKRVMLKEKAVENEKYAFRCFLLRLGFIGEEYKTARKILLRNLIGNASWKGGTVE